MHIICTLLAHTYLHTFYTEYKYKSISTSKIIKRACEKHKFFARPFYCAEIRHNLLEVRESAGNFDGIRERYTDKRISSEALSLIGQRAGSTELIEMGKSMEVTNIKKKSLLLQTVREENCTSAFRMTEQRNHII